MGPTSAECREKTDNTQQKRQPTRRLSGGYKTCWVPLSVILGPFLPLLGLDQSGPIRPIWTHRGGKREIHGEGGLAVHYLGCQNLPRGLPNQTGNVILFQNFGASCLLAAACCQACKPNPLTLMFGQPGQTTEYFSSVTLTKTYPQP